MSDTLEALCRAVIANPTDRTVRLIYADALDESGDSVQVARAEFIRGQIELESSDEPSAQTETRCAELFEANWLQWWAPVAEAARLPYPHVPRRRRSKSARQPRIPANWPYSHTTADTTVHLIEYGMSFKFAGGFPEEVRCSSFDSPEGGPTLMHHWGEAIPLRRLSLASYASLPEWSRVDGSHLARLTDLSFERMLPDVAQRVAETPHLAGLTHLTANPHGSDPEAIRALVAHAPWKGLRSLEFSGRMTPDGVRRLRMVAHCSIWRSLT